jgi:hypothetical protein
MSWRHGLTPEQQREAEMNRGAEVLVEKHGADGLREILAREFDPNYVPHPTHHVSAESKEYNRRLREANKNRPDMK